MAALAYGVLPARHALGVEQRAEAVLPLLDRFSPVAYVAVGVLALSGIYSAAHHLDAPSMLASTLYGQILVVKLGLVGVLALLSGSHVLWLRPRIGRARYRATLLEHPGEAARYMASVHEGLAVLASRLRLEAWVGAAILLATALMSQTLPADGAGHGGGSVATSPAPISRVVTRGDLRALLTVASPAIGTTTFTVRLWEQGRPLTGATGAAIVHLSPAAQPTLRAVLTPSAHGPRFTAQGSLAVTGTWHADLLVRTVTVNEYRTLPFVFVVGPHAHFVAAQRAMTAMAGM
jgi:copper transport protein